MNTLNNLTKIPAQTIMMRGIHIEFEGVNVKSHYTWKQDNYGFWRCVTLSTYDVLSMINHSNSVGFYGKKNPGSYIELRSLWSN